MKRRHIVIENLKELMIVIVSRFRVSGLRLRGTEVAEKVLIGRWLKVDKPWCVSIGLRTKLEDSVSLKIVDDEARLVIGSYSFLGRGVEIDCQCSIAIGDHVLIAPRCFITDHNHGLLADTRIDQQPCQVRAVTIEDDVWIGANVIILPGISIGKGAVVGAGAVVNRDIDPYSISAGVPARTIGHRIPQLPVG